MANTAYELAVSSNALIEALEAKVKHLSDEVFRVNAQLATAKNQGLGPHLMAPYLLKKYLPHLNCIEALAKRAIEQINGAE